MDNCVFCKIIDGEIPSDKVYEDEFVLAFRDIRPQAPVHLLVVPKQHVVSADGINAGNSACAAHIFEAIPEIAKRQGIENNYRIICNCGESVGQTVFHLHFHILSGGTGMSEKLI